MSKVPEIAPKKDIPRLELEENEVKFRDHIILAAQNAYNQRQQAWPEFDDMTYEQAYISNAKAANAYIPPKNNPEDVRTVTGVTREKSNTLVSALLNYNLKPNVMAFDENDLPATLLGDTMADCIAKSRKLEFPMYENKRPDVIKELVDQGTVFVEEKWIEYAHLKKDIKNKKEVDLLRVQWDEEAEYVTKQATTDLLYGPSVYLGNMRQPYFILQPFVIVRREITRAEAEAIYGRWPHWKYVGCEVVASVPSAMSGTMSNWGSWSMVETSVDMVEEIKYFNPWTNTYQVMLQGVPMLKPGFPLSFLTGQCRIPIACGKLEPLPHFAYGRGFGHKNKFNQALYDEMYKGIILKMRKSYQPPMANNTGQTLSKKIFFPANITNNIDPDKLREIGNNQGITNSDTGIMQFLKQIIDESSVTSQFQGAGGVKEQTARETVELKQQQLMKLGLSIVGLMNLEIDLAWLRLFTILRHWTEPIDHELYEAKGQLKKVNKYRTESIESEFEDSEKGMRVVNFMEGELPHPEQVSAEDALMTKMKNKTIKNVYLNVEDLQNLRYRWFIDVVPTEKETSDLRAALFMDNLTQFMQLFGPQALNIPNAKRRWVLLNHEDPEKFLAEEVPQQPMLPPGTEGQPPSDLQSQLQPKPLPKPSLNTMMGG